jgi:hypothetical protein
MNEQFGINIKSQVSLIADEIQASTKGDKALVKMSICNLMGAAFLLAGRNGFVIEEVMQTFEALWGPVVEALADE